MVNMTKQRTEKEITLQCPFDRWRVKPQCFRMLPRLDQFTN